MKKFLSAGILTCLVFMLASVSAAGDLVDADQAGFAGKPISLANGSETLKRVDLTIGTSFPIKVQRRYHSKSGYDSPLGYGWAHNYDMRLYAYADGSVVIRKETGWKRKFAESGGSYTTPAGEYGTLVKNGDDSFTYTLKDGTKQEFDARGRLSSIVKPTGASLVFTYGDVVREALEGALPTNVDPDTPKIVAYDYRLAKIEEKNPGGSLTGVFVNFDYNTSTGRLIGLTDSNARSVSYFHDAIGNLTSVSTPESSATYGYTDTYRNHLLTSIDEGEGEYVNTYDAKGRVIQQTHGNNVIDIEYIPYQKTTTVTTTVKDDAGTTLSTNARTLVFDDNSQVIKVTDNDGNETNFTRDGNGKVLHEEHYKNTGTVQSPVLVKVTENDYVYDGNGNLQSKTRGTGTAVEHTVAYTYHPTFNKPLTRTETSVVNPAQSKVTTNTYDVTTGSLLTVQETGYLGDGNPYSYTTIYTYDSVTKKIASIDGPRTGVSDVTSFGYDTAGNLSTITRPLSGTTTFSNFNGLGQPQTVTDANNNATLYTYDDTGKVLTVKAPGDANATVYTYISAGCGSCGGSTQKIDTITLPLGNIIDYDYDTYGNLIKISDSLGNSVNYTYDSAGKRLSEEIKDPQNVIKKSLSYQYDAFGQLYRVTNPDTSYTEYGYDSLGNRISVTDPNTNTTTYDYDELNRLVSAVQPGTITTGFAYDIHGNLTTVTDGNTNATTYVYDDMGRVYQVVSPDTGTTTYTYDAAGNMVSKTDAKSITVNYSYDAENRLTLIDYPSDTDVTYSYDTCINGKGKLCNVTDQSGTTAIEYSVKGQISKETKNILGVNYITQYGYDMNGNLTSMIYPTGRTIAYGYTNNRISSVQQNSINVATNIAYAPFGGINSMTYGNGLTRTVGYDTQYRINSIASGSIQNLTYGFDSNSNITSITDNITSTNNKGYGYDALDRLTSSTGPYGSISWTYDAVGNRQTQIDGTGTSTYSYQSNSNRLTNITGAYATSMTLDNNGNTTTEGNKTYTFNQNNRLIQAADTSGTLGTYTYNARGQRATKATTTGTTVFHYDYNGVMIAETDQAGIPITEYVNLDSQPLARIDTTGTSYIHNDHLGTPQMMSDASGTKVWEVQPRPFGDQPTITGTQSLNHRFPGQYFDNETGLHQNWFRDYNPMIGRYVEADPIGFAGGDVNLYRYVKNRPVWFTDPLGLWPAKTVEEVNNRKRRLLEMINKIINCREVSWEIRNNAKKISWKYVNRDDPDSDNEDEYGIFDGDSISITSAHWDKNGNFDEDEAWETLFHELQHSRAKVNQHEDSRFQDWVDFEMNNCKNKCL